MNLLSKIASGLGLIEPNESPKPYSLQTADEIILYVEGLIGKDLSPDLIKKVQDAKKLPLDQRERAYIPIYFELEKLVLKSSSYSKISLRQEIRNKFPLGKTGIRFGLIFLPGRQQNLLLFELAIESFIGYIVSNLGPLHLETIVKSATKGTILEKIVVTKTGLNFENVFKELDSIDGNALASVYQKLYDAIQTEVSVSIGQSQTKDIINKVYQFVKANYEYEIVGQFLSNLPENVLSEERLTYLSREELEKLIEDRTKELKVVQERELAKAKELLKLKDEFVFIAAHDLRTPVTAISGFISLIKQRKGNLDTDMQENLNSIEEGSDRLKQLINDLLEVARSDSGTIKVKLSNIDIVSLIDKTIKEVGPSAAVKNVTITSNLDRSQNLVVADDEKVSEVLENLLSNAIKYNREGGKIDVATKAEAGRLSVSIADTGYGIPKEQQEQVFQKFFRARQKDTQNVSGTGLGLFLVRMLMEKMGGTISFMSEEGKGTIFVFSLPLASA